MWNLPTSRYVKAFEPQLNAHSSSSKKKERSCSEDTQMSSCSEDDDNNMLLPEIVPVSSLGSFSDSSSTLSSSGRTSPASTGLSTSPKSPRSIFKNYWSSPSSGGLADEGCRAPMTTLQMSSGGTEEELMHRLESLSLPFVIDEEDSSSPPPSTTAATDCSLTRSSSAHAAPSPPMVNTMASPRRPSIDDTTIDYGMNKKRLSSSSTPRRQILPTSATPSNIARQQQVQRSSGVALRDQTQRKWSSTSALIKRPSHSCLRPSRYSCSMIDERKLSQHHHHHQDEKNKVQHEDEAASAAVSAIAARAALSRSKSVSFYSQVSVFEFVKSKELEEVRSKDWSKYFA